MKMSIKSMRIYTCTTQWCVHSSKRERTYDQSDEGGRKVAAILGDFRNTVHDEHGDGDVNQNHPSGALCEREYKMRMRII